jgi:tetratricopeptide (TPR) repeat protein
MTPADIVERLRQAGGDPEQLLLATVDIALATHEPRLREALEGAAIPHWFDDRILARLLDTNAGEAALLKERLKSLPMVEPFASREAWNVHESTRLALRRKIHNDQPERFRKLSAIAASCWPEDGVIPRVESIYHRLSSEPEEGAAELERTYWKWQRSGRREATQALGTALEELKPFPLADAARGRVLLILGWIRLGWVPVAQSEHSARQAVEMLERTGPAASCGDAHGLLGQALQQRGNLAGALAEYQACKGILGDLSALDPANTDWQRDLSVSHGNVGKVYQAQGRLTEALAEYQACKRILEDLTALDPARTDWERDLSVSHNNVGSVYQAQGRITEALAEYQASKRTRESLTALDAANTDWQRDLSVSHNYVGRVYQAQGRLAEALAGYQASKRIMEGLTALDPANTDWQRDLSVSHNYVGRVYQAQGRVAEALAEYQACKRIKEGLAALDPANTDWQRDLSVSHNYVGSVYQAHFGTREK